MPVRSRAIGRARTRTAEAYRRVLADAVDRPPLYLALTFGVTVAGTAIIRGLHMLTYGDGTVVSWLGVVPGLVAAGALIAGLVTAYWHVRLDGRARDPYMLAFATSVAVVGVCTEVFSGVTATLWLEEHVAAAGDVRPSLWRVERYYLWHLVDAIPLVEVPQTVRWSEPLEFIGLWSGAILLVFKLMVIVPLARIAVSGYALALDGFVRLTERHRRRATKKAAEGAASRYGRYLTRDVSALDIWATAASTLVVTIVGYFVLEEALAPSSLVHNWLTTTFPEGIHVWGHSRDLPWLLDAVDCVIAAAGLWTFLSLVGVLAEYLFEAIGFGGRSARAGAFAATILLLGPAVIAASAVSIALLHVGWAGTTPMLSSADEVSSTVNWFAWHLANVIPVLDLTNTLNWDLHTEFVDGWTAFLLLAAKLLLVSLLVWPIALLARVALARARDRRPQHGLLAGIADFRRLLDSMSVLIDDAEEVVLAARQWDYYQARNQARNQARRAVRELDAAIDQLRVLFGPSEVLDAAEAAGSKLTERFRALGDVGTEMFFIGADRDDRDNERLTRLVDAVSERRRACQECIARFDTSVSAALIATTD